MGFAVGMILLVGLVFLAALVVGLVAWSRHEAGDSGQMEPSPPPSRMQALGRPRSDREVRTGARHLTTEPETEEARALKRRLTEAVSDLADNVEEMPERSEGSAARRLTSEEMIARAKRRIRDRADDPEI